MAQYVIDKLVDTPYAGIRSRILIKSYTVMRRALIRLGDPAVKYNVRGITIEIPLSHNLPIDTSNFPEYNDDIARLARLIQEKYPDCSMIDIGANVGDTAAVLRSAVTSPILCIDGDETYFNYLDRNKTAIGNVDTFLGYIDIKKAQYAIAKDWSGGTSSIKESSGTGRQITTARLSEILEGRPKFSRAKLLKIDTDGYDGRIIRGSADWLQKAHPVIFFEYAPWWWKSAGDHGPDIFNDLLELGYTHAAVIDEMGGIVMRIRVDDKEAQKQLCGRYKAEKGCPYCDIAAFHSEDTDIWNRFS